MLVLVVLLPGAVPVQRLVLGLDLLGAMLVNLLVELLREAALHGSQWAILPVRVCLQILNARQGRTLLEGVLIAPALIVLLVDLGVSVVDPRGTVDH